MAKWWDHSDVAVDGFDGQFLHAELPDFPDQETLESLKTGMALDAPECLLINAPLQSGMSSLPELVRAHEKEVTKGFRTDAKEGEPGDMCPPGSPNYAAAPGLAYRLSKGWEGRPTHDFRSPRNKVSHSGEQLSPNAHCDLSDSDLYPSIEWVTISGLFPNLTALSQAHRWMADQDPAVEDSLAIAGVSTDASAYYRWIKKKRRDQHLQTTYTARPGVA